MEERSEGSGKALAKGGIELEKEKMLHHLDNAISGQVPDSWEHIKNKLDSNVIELKRNVVIQGNFSQSHNKKDKLKRFTAAAAICLLTASMLAFTPALAAIQEAYDKLFSNVDDKGLKSALESGHGQSVGQSYYDEEHGIAVNLDSVLTDDKEAKLLLTYQSEKLNLKNYYLDIFEGKTSISLIDEKGNKKKLHSVGWGSRYYDKKENKVAAALSFESIKEYKGQTIRFEIENLTIWNGKDKAGALETVWPLGLTLDKSAVSEREIVPLQIAFKYAGETYTIKQAEYSGLETRVTVTGTDTQPHKAQDGKLYQVKSKLELQLLNARKIDKEYGYIVAEGKSGVFLKSAGERVDPIFSKGEVPGPLDEYIMVFAPVKDRTDVTLEVGEELKIPLTR